MPPACVCILSPATLAEAQTSVPHLAPPVAPQASNSRYCPQLLADYLILAASPSSAKARQLLGFSGLPAAALEPTTPERGGKGCENGGGAAAATAAEAARRAEEEVLACEPLSQPVAAALRRGAYALYGACSAGEVQFLYASLGSAGARDSSGGGPWRAALAALKGDHERHFRYTGKV